MSGCRLVECHLKLSRASFRGNFLAWDGDRCDLKGWGTGWSPSNTSVYYKIFKNCFLDAFEAENALETVKSTPLKASRVKSFLKTIRFRKIPFGKPLKEPLTHENPRICLMWAHKLLSRLLGKKFCRIRWILGHFLALKAFRKFL